MFDRQGALHLPEDEWDRCTEHAAEDERHTIPCDAAGWRTSPSAVYRDDESKSDMAVNSAVIDTFAVTLERTPGAQTEAGRAWAFGSRQPGFRACTSGAGCTEHQGYATHQ